MLAIISSALWRRAWFRDKYRLDVLASISSGAAIMFLIDSIFNYLEEGVFLELSWNALILSMLLIALTTIIWAITLLSTKIFESK